MYNEFDIKICVQKGAIYMKENAFIRFFLFVTAITAVLGILLFIFSRLFQLETPLLYVILYIGFCLYSGVGMGLFGHVYANNTTITLNNTNNTIGTVGNMLDSSKYAKFKETNNEIVFCPNRYNEWFYGKIYIQSNGNKITIKAAKCIINKYFIKIN